MEFGLERLRFSGDFNRRIVFKALYKLLPNRDRSLGTLHLYEVFDGAAPRTPEEEALAASLRVFRRLVGSPLAEEDVLATLPDYLRIHGVAESPPVSVAGLAGPDDPYSFYFSLCRALPEGGPYARFALIALDAALLRGGRLPIVAGPSAAGYLFLLPRCGVDADGFDFALTHLIDLSVMYNVRNPTTDLKAVEAAVSSHGGEIRALFRVSEIWAIGSIVKGYFDDFSDLDFLVRFEGEDRPKGRLKAYLSGLIGRRADVMDLASAGSRNRDVAPSAHRIDLGGENNEEDVH